MRRAILLFGFLSFWGLGAADEHPHGEHPHGESSLVEPSLEEKAERYHATQQEPFEGVVFGEIRDGKQRYASAGRMGEGRPVVSPQTLFEIGSITKTFTGILLADAVCRGRVGLDDPVAGFLPAKYAEDLPAESPLRMITLEQLATHTSGLPRIPADLAAGGDPDDPYAHYTTEKMFRYVSGLAAPDLEKPGGMSYSNLGFGLLGAILEQIAGEPYEDLVARVIFEPLGMENSFVQRTRDALPEESSPLFATGHSRGKAVPAWRIDAHCGAGAIVSSAEDMLRYAEAHLTGNGPAELQEAIRLATQTRQGGMGLGWFVDDSRLFHDGGTGGFRSRLEIDREKKTALLMMKNSTGKVISFSRKGDFSPVAGYWRGDLETGQVTLPILMRIREDGAVYSHSLAQSVRGIPGASSSFDGKKLMVEFPAIGGQLKVNLGEEQLEGHWRQGKTFSIAFRREEEIPGSLLAFLRERMEGEVKDIAGYWSGYLGGKQGLFVVLEIEAIEETGEARFFSPDQSDAAIEVTQFKREGETISLEAGSIGASYEARMESGREMSGTWSQGSLLPLTLRWSGERPVREKESGKD